MDKNEKKLGMSFEEFMIKELEKELAEIMEDILKSKSNELFMTQIKTPHPIAKPKMDKMFEGTLQFKEQPKKDMINHPPHYNFGKYECLDVIEDVLGKEGFKAYLKGNILKYLWRTDKKNGAEDLKKASFYLNRLISISE